MTEEFNSEMQELLKDFNPQPTQRYQQRMQKEAAWLRDPTQKETTAWWKAGPFERRRLVSTVATVVLVSCIGILAFPSIKAIAQDLERYFNRLDTNTQQHTIVVEPTPAQKTPIPLNMLGESYSLTMAEARSQSGLEIREPNLLPDGFRLLGATVNENFARFRFESTNRTPPIYSIEMSVIEMGGNLNLVYEIGEDAVVETVPIGDLTGEYVEGAWSSTTEYPMDAEPGTEINMTYEWRSDVGAILRWQDDTLVYSIRPHQNMTKSNLIAIAQCMYTPFDILEPAYSLNGLRRHFDSKDIECDLPSQLVTQIYWTRGQLLVFRQAPLDTDMPMVVSEQTSETFNVDGQQASFIQGLWNAPLPDHAFLGEVDPVTSGLRWKSNGMLLELWSVGSNRRVGEIDKTMLMAIAATIM